jgi:hypothetical protein
VTNPVGQSGGTSLAARLTALTAVLRLPRASEEDLCVIEILEDLGEYVERADAADPIASGALTITIPPGGARTIRLVSAASRSLSPVDPARSTASALSDPRREHEPAGQMPTEFGERKQRTIDPFPGLLLACEHA